MDSLEKTRARYARALAKAHNRLEHARQAKERADDAYSVRLEAYEAAKRAMARLPEVKG